MRFVNIKEASLPSKPFNTIRTHSPHSRILRLPTIDSQDSHVTLLSQQADINEACRSIKTKVATTALVRERTQIPLVYGHATIMDPDINNVGAAFMLMECLRGNCIISSFFFLFPFYKHWHRPLLSDTGLH